MRTTFIYNLILLMVMVMNPYSSPAQDYLVTTKNDTLKGIVKLLTYTPEKKVQVTSDQKKKSVIPIFSTKVIMLNGETYRPVRNENGYAFMKLIKDGYLCLYTYQIEDQVAYNGFYLVMRDGRRMQVPNLNFKNIMSNFLEGDCASVAGKISDGTFGRKDLMLIIDSFNQCITDKTSSMVQISTTTKILTTKINEWTKFEEKINLSNDFDQKNNALEIITEIKNKIQLNNKIPNYLSDALRNALTQTLLKNDLEIILKDYN